MRSSALERAQLLRLRQLVVEPEQPAPDLAPDPVARRAVGLALAEGDGYPRRRARRTNSAMSRDLPMPASAAMPTTEPLPSRARTKAPPARRARPRVRRSAGRTARGAAAPATRARELEDGDGRLPALDGHLGQALPLEAVAGRVVHGAGRRRSCPGGAFDISRAARLTGRRGTRTCGAWRARTCRCARGRARSRSGCSLRRVVRLELAELERGGGRARGIVLVRERRTEDRVQVGALVAQRQLEQVAAVVGEHALGAADEVVELRGRLVVRVVVDAAEAHEHGERGPQLGQELPAPGAQPLVDRGQAARAARAPRAAGRRARRRGASRAHARRASATTPTSRPASSVPPLAERDAVAQRLERGLVRARPRPSRPGARRRRVVDQPPARTSRAGSPDRRRRTAAPRPTATATFIASCTLVPPGVATCPTRAIVSCIASAAGDGARAVVAVEPAGDRVAAEVDDVAAERVELGDDRVEDAVQVRRQLFRARAAGRARARAPRSAG